MPHTKLRIHLILSTYKRHPLITDAVEPVLYDALRTLAPRAGGAVLDLGGVADHVHLIIALRPARALSDFVRVVKSGSCRTVRETFGPDAFRWSSGYGAFSLNPANLQGIHAYVARQKEHHRAGQVRTEWERVE